MKYNGMEVTEEFIERVHGKLEGMRCYEIRKVLGAAEEVFAEMQPELLRLKKGDRVTHNLNPKWGKGTVRWVSKSGKSAEVKFDSGGWGEPLVKNLTKIEEAQHGEG